jgi:hypothetical protein
MERLRALAAAFCAVPVNAGPAAFDTYLENEAAAYRTGDVGKLGRIVNDRLDAASEKPDRLLIYVDQWEELYAMAPAAEEAEQRLQHSDDVERFIALLVAAAACPRRRATVVLTVRADFYNPLIRQTHLSTLLPRQQVNIRPMESSDLRSAIETPAKKVELSFAPPTLIDQILNDVGVEEGRLPLLQFALKETWERREGDRRQFLEQVSSDPALARDLILRFSIRLRRIEDKIAGISGEACGRQSSHCPCTRAALQVLRCRCFVQ